MAFFDDVLEKLYRGWGGKPAHPNSPCGSGGAGGFSQSYPLGIAGKCFSKLPHPDSPASKQLIPQDIKKSLTDQLKENKTMSKEGLTLLKQIEMLRLKPYDDQTGKEITTWTAGATIGYGYLITKTEWSKYKDGLSEADALALFKQKLIPFEAVVRNNVTVKLKQNEFDALVILAYNIGTAGLKGSSVLKLVNDSKAKTSFKSLETAWKAWNKSQGKVMKGLDNRRQAEWNIYSQGIYKGW